ncbi:MAG: HD domain-containing phosphohydrolase [Desulfosudaceae bacterium]
MGKNNHLLIVDDEKRVLQSLERVLRDDDYRIFTATSGKEGLAVLSEEEIGVVVSDLMMPEMDGMQFLEAASKINPDAVQILLTGQASLDTAVNAINRLGLFCFIVKPWKNQIIKSDIFRAFEKYRLLSENKRLYQITVEQNQELAEWNENLEERVKIRTQLLEEAVGETINTLARIAESKDNDSEGHIYRVGNLVLDLCRHLALPDEEAEKISQFSLVHDIGKINVNDRVLGKEPPLTAEETEEIQAHTMAGEALLGVKSFYQTGREIARSHHENWDGSGYPDGLAGREIPLAARIVAVVDTFDCLTRDNDGTRKNKAALLEALKTIRALAGSRLDPDITETFLKMQINKFAPKKENKRPKETAVTL